MFRNCTLPATKFIHKLPTVIFRRDLASLRRVGVFLDLDNECPSQYNRQAVKEFLEPIDEMIKQVGGVRDILKVFANKATQTHFPEEDLEMEGWEQDWIRELDQSGYDKDGYLRCGICQQKMKLKAKDKARGLTLEQKLDIHMRSLHDREQKKRKTRRKQKKGKMSAKDNKKWDKYNAAQVGFRTQGNKNDLFQLFKENNAICESASDVDALLQKHATNWMKKVRKRHDLQPYEGCLVVVSRDKDFCKLLQSAQARNFVAISASLSSPQTAALVEQCDIYMEVSEAEPKVAASSDVGTKVLSNEQIQLLRAESEDMYISEMQQ